MYAAIENVSDIMARKMRKVKDKAIMKGKWDGRAGPRGTAHSISAVCPRLSCLPGVRSVVLRNVCVCVGRGGGTKVKNKPSCSASGRAMLVLRWPPIVSIRCTLAYGPPFQ